MGLLADWRILAIIAVCIFYGGWRSHTIYDGYVLQKQQKEVIKNLGEGQSEIIKFNQKFNKVKSDAKDCINQSIPPNVVELLK